MNIVKFPNTALRVPRIDVSREDDVSDLVKEMIDTMYANSGVGLAAPQVNVHKALFVMDWTGGDRNDTLTVVINPVIISHSGDDQQVSPEGCLSIPGVFANVNRWSSIVATWFNEKREPVTKELSGPEAAIFQHEFDHLGGIVFTDRLSQFAKKLAFKGYGNQS